MPDMPCYRFLGTASHPCFRSLPRTPVEGNLCFSPSKPIFHLRFVRSFMATPRPHYLSLQVNFKIFDGHSRSWSVQLAWTIVASDPREVLIFHMRRKLLTLLESMGREWVSSISINSSIPHRAFERVVRVAFVKSRKSVGEPSRRIRLGECSLVAVYREGLKCHVTAGFPGAGG
jgi:hypothetical protein